LLIWKDFVSTFTFPAHKLMLYRDLP